MAIITRDHEADSNRYKYDFKYCHYKNGWAQLDTSEDAWYYGNWINPLKLELFSYVEGDLIHTKCDDEAEFAAKVRESVAWQQEHGFFKGIDGMCEQPIIEAFERMGLKEFLH